MGRSRSTQASVIAEKPASFRIVAPNAEVANRLPATAPPLGRLRGQHSARHPNRPRAARPAPDTQRRFARRIRVGLLVTRRWAYVVWDRLTSMTFEANQFDVRRAPTTDLLTAAGLPLERRGSA